MSLGGIIFSEFINDNTFIILGLFLITIIIVRSFSWHEYKRIIGIGILFSLHFLLVPVTALLREIKSPVYTDVRLACLIFAVMSVISMSGLLIFKVLLPKLRLHPPLILQDLFISGISVITFFSIASRNGYNLSGLIATSAVLTAIIGFSLQDSLINIMGGVAIQMDNSIGIGDWIKVEDKPAGRVVEIRWRYTAIETRNWETLIIPNSALIKNSVTVLGRRSDKPLQWRRWVYFNIDFRFSPSDVIEVVLEALNKAEINNIADEPAINCILMDLQDSYAKYAVRYWLTDIAADDPTDSEVRISIYYALKRAGIPLSMPAQALFVTQESKDRKVAKNKEEISHHIELLEKVELFNHLPKEELELVAARLRAAPFKKGEIITKQGAEAHWLYLIKHGEVSIHVANEKGLECEVARLGAGNFFGEMSLMTGAKRSATVIALTDVDCYRFDKTSFQEIIKKRPDMAEEFAVVLAKRKTELDARRENLNHEEKASKLTVNKMDILGKIIDFFALHEHHHH